MRASVPSGATCRARCTVFILCVHHLCTRRFLIVVESFVGHSWHRLPQWGRNFGWKLQVEVRFARARRLRYFFSRVILVVKSLILKILSPYYEENALGSVKGFTQIILSPYYQRNALGVVKGPTPMILSPYYEEKCIGVSKGTHPDNTKPILSKKCMGCSKAHPNNTKPKL